MEILNDYTKWHSILVPKEDRYFDLVLSRCNAQTIHVDGTNTERCLISYFDFSNPECVSGNTIISLDNFKYDKAINEESEIHDFALTATDNGQVLFDKNTITPDEYREMLTNTLLELPTGDVKTYLHTVNGNTKQVTYQDLNYEPENKYISLKGGFLQGFFKLDGYKYQVLPDVIDNAWDFEITVRPRSDYQTSGNTLNDLHPENNGILFYIGSRAENKFAQYYDSTYLDYELRDSGCTESSGETFTTSNEHEATSNDLQEFETDNQYLIYNRTCNGETTKTWQQGDKYTLQVKKPIESSINTYLLLNRTCSGLTTCNLEDYIKENNLQPVSSLYDINKDIFDNAFAIKRYQDGSIGYQYLIKDCDNESGFTVEEEHTDISNLVKDNEWTTVHVVLKRMNGVFDTCGKPLGNDKMKIYIYINGYLKLVSKELPMLNLHRLNDFSDKQIGVPFNLSIGGGTQGLLERTWINEYDGSCRILPLEKYFCGSFIGDIQSFKFYDCQLQYNEIKNNYLYELNNSTSSLDINKTMMYYGSGVEAQPIYEKGLRGKLLNTPTSKYDVTIENDGNHIYFMYDEKTPNLKPYIYSCGGAPVLIEQSHIKIDNIDFVVDKTVETYNKGEKLTILTYNF